MFRNSRTSWMEEKERTAQNIEDCKKLKKKIEKNDCEKEKLKMTCVKFIPKQVAKPENIFFLRGGILVDLNYDNENTRISNMNFVIQVRSCTIVRSQKIVYTEFQTGGVDYDSHEQAISTLISYADFEMNQLAEALKRHEIKMFQDAFVKQQVLQVISNNSFVQQSIQIKEKEFQDFRESVIKSLPRDKIFHFIDFGFDSNGMSMKVLGEGFNDKYCNLMGCDIDTFQDISLRKGILEFKQSNMRIKLLHKMIELFLKGGSQQSMSGDVSIITLDDILIDCQFNSDVYFSPSYSAVQSFFHPQYINSLFDRGFAVIELILTDFHIHKINAIRSKYQHEATILSNSYNYLLHPKQVPLIINKPYPQNVLINTIKGLVEQKQSIHEPKANEANSRISNNQHHLQQQYDWQEQGSMSSLKNSLCKDSTNSLSQDQIFPNLPQQLNNQNSTYFSEASQYPSDSSQTIQDQKNQNYLLNSTFFEQFSSPFQPIQTINNSKNSSVQNLLADIPHQIYCQFFVEQFYSQFPSQQNQKLLTVPGRCGYRIIPPESNIN